MKKIGLNLRWPALVAILLMTSACSEFIYSSAQNNHQQRCEKLAPHQYDECRAQADQSFKDYKSDREALLKPDSDTKVAPVTAK